MTRPFAGLAALLAGLSAVAAAPVPRDPGGPLYFPTAAGAEWVYERPGRGDETVVVSGAERDDGGVMVSRAGAGENGRVYADVVVDAGGLRQEQDGPAGPEAVWLLKRGARKGDSWAVPGGTRTTHGPEPVEVPAGKYVAVRVVQEKDGVRTTSWYAPGVGEVKRAEKVGDGEEAVTRLLKSFRPR